MSIDRGSEHALDPSERGVQRVLVADHGRGLCSNMTCKPQYFNYSVDADHGEEPHGEHPTVGDSCYTQCFSTTNREVAKWQWSALASDLDLVHSHGICTYRTP